jgi:transketolase
MAANTLQYMLTTIDQLEMQMASFQMQISLLRSQIKAETSTEVPWPDPPSAHTTQPMVDVPKEVPGPKKIKIKKVKVSVSAATPDDASTEDKKEKKPSAWSAWFTQINKRHTAEFDEFVSRMNSQAEEAGEKRPRGLSQRFAKMWREAHEDEWIAFLADFNSNMV